MSYKGVDIRFRIKTLIETGRLKPVEVSDELRKRFLRRFITLPVKALLAGVVLSIAAGFALGFVAKYKLLLYLCAGIIAVTVLLGFITVWHMLWSALNIRNKDYGFYEGEIVDTYRDGYQILGFEDDATLVLFGRKNYARGDKVIVARMGEDLRIISE